MKIFVTGATGWIGGALVRDLLADGHTVLGLARSDAAAAALVAAGVEAHRGSLEEPDSLAAGARAADGVVHLGFIHDFTRFEENLRIDRQAVEAMLDALAGTGKPFVGTSGTMMVAGAALAVETDPPASEEGRGGTELLVTRAAARDVRGTVVRLSPTVHGAGEEHGFVPILIARARERGMAGYPGEGASRWPAVHRDDAARLFALALEKGQAGATYHGVAEEGVPVRAIAEAIGEGLGVPVRSVGADEAAAQFGLLARFAATDDPTSSALTRQALDWAPSGPGLLADMRANYFG